MITNKTIKLTIASLALLSSSIANASIINEFLTNMLKSTDTDYNYIGGKIGGVFPTNIQGSSDLQDVSPDTTYTTGFSVGRKIDDSFAIELEYTHRGESNINNSSLSSSDNVRNEWGVKADTLMLNTVIDVISDNSIRPYVKFGIGASRNESNDYKYSDKVSTRIWGGKITTKFAWQAAFGFSTSLTKTTDANIEYSYIDRGSFRSKNGSQRIYSNGNVTTNSNSEAKIGKLKEQVLTIGVKYKF